MGINLLTFNQATIAPKDDALIQQYALGQDGFFYGGTPTYTGGNTIHFQSGEGMMCGREFVLEDTDVSAALPASGTLLGQVYIHVDLSNVDNPIELICETAETLTELTKDENLNVNNGTYDLQLCTFTANVSNITDLVSQIKQIKKGGGGSDENLARVEEGTTATAPYAAGEHVVVNGVYHLVTAAIAIGDAFEEGTNIDVKTVGEEITALNQNLTKINTTTKTLWGYINGVWVDLHIRAYYDSIPVYVNGVFGIAVDNGVYKSSTAFGTPKAFTNANNQLQTGSLSNAQECTFVSQDTINFSQYNRVKVTTNLGTIVCDVSQVNEPKYLAVAITNYGGGVYTDICAITAKQQGYNMSTNVAADAYDSAHTGVTSAVITEIVVE